MKLIRINPDHFIIADDLEIKVGDVVVEKLTTAEYEIFEIHTLNDIDVTSQKLVTYSTQPLYYDRIKTLDLSEVKELIDNNKEKEYTKENLIKAILLWDNHINIKEEDKGCVSKIEAFVQSLQLEWDVKFVNDKLKLQGSGR